MKIGLAVYEFKNIDIEFNLSQIKKAMKSAQGKVDLLCFGESFLQGFDSLNWNYDLDKHIAVSYNSDIMCRLCAMTLHYEIDLLFGYIEYYNDSIYSSCVVIEKGKITHNYRRISKGWKALNITDERYKEGTSTNEFMYHNQNFMIALCGDMWDYPQLFKTNHILIWPIYVNFSLEEWEKYEIEYAEQTRLAAYKTLEINSISENPKSYGGAFYFVDGKLKKRTAYGTEEILVVEV